MPASAPASYPDTTSATPTPRRDADTTSATPTPRRERVYYGIWGGLPTIGSSSSTQTDTQRPSGVAFTGDIVTFMGDLMASGLTTWLNRYVNKPPAPPDSAAMYASIEQSRGMLDWPDDWDGDGSPGYRPETWERAKDLVLQYAESLWREDGIAIAVPRILPGAEGSIDIHWRTPGCEILANVPADAGAPITYYGDDRTRQHSAKGTLAHETAPDAWFRCLLTHLAA